MSTAPTVPYRLEFRVEVPGTPEQVWHAIATATGMSAWFLPTTIDEREGGALHISMGEDMGSDGHVTAWEPPRRLVYEEDWAALMGKDPATLSPLTSEFVIESNSGGTCVVRVTTSGFGTGADWEQDWWEDMGRSWRPAFDNLRRYLAHFAGQEATMLEVSAPLPGDAPTVWRAMRDAMGGPGDEVTVHDVTGTLEDTGDRQGTVLLTGPVPGFVNAYAYDNGDGTSTAVLRGFLFAPEAPAFANAEKPAWESWLAALPVPA